MSQLPLIIFRCLYTVKILENTYYNIILLQYIHTIYAGLESLKRQFPFVKKDNFLLPKHFFQFKVTFA